ncbi:MAG: twin-arginine translocase subunit TatC [Bdellovibrionota bacterium]
MNHNEHASVDEAHLTLIEHLRELRVRLVQSFWALLIFSGICYGFSDIIFEYVRLPIVKYLPSGGLIYTGPLDKFMAHIKLAFVCGIILSCPWWIFQIWKFVAPGLYKNEKKYTVSFLVAGSTLFLIGVAFAYFVVLPSAFEFLLTFGGDTDKPMISIDHYLAFFTQMCLVFGVAFELPLILVILGMLGIVNQRMLREKRKHSIFAMAVVAAVITPPDLMSMIMMLIPMVILYEIAVIFVGFVEKKNAAV